MQQKPPGAEDFPHPGESACRYRLLQLFGQTLQSLGHGLLEGGMGPQAAAQLAQWSLTPHLWGKRFEEKHVFTHITWEMTVFCMDVTGDGPAGWFWRTEEEREKFPMPTAFGKLEKE